MMLIHAEPPFERIVIYHSDPSSKEYNDIDAEYIDYIPEVDFWDEDVKNLFILEDINFKRLKRDQKDLVDRYYGCFSTHHNISVWSTFQRAFSCPAEIRDMSNIMLLWKSKNLNSLSQLSSRLGIEAEDLKYIFHNIRSIFHQQYYISLLLYNYCVMMHHHQQYILIYDLLVYLLILHLYK